MTRVQVVVRLDQVHVHYDRAHIGPVSHDIDRGSWMCFIGPNGAGKSSVLKAIAGLVAREGTIRIDGHDTRGMALSASTYGSSAAPNTRKPPMSRPMGIATKDAST